MPSRLNFETLVPGTDEQVVYALIPNNELMAAGVKPLGTALKNHPFMDMQGATAYADYILGGYEMVSIGGAEFVRANFAKDYSVGSAYAAATLTDYPKRPHAWPPVLGSILLSGCSTGDIDMVGTTHTSHVILIPPDIPVVDVKWSKDGYDGVTKFKREVFLKNSQHDLHTTTGGLYPRSVQFNRHVFSVSIPPCLHAAIQVPDIAIDITPQSLTVVYPVETFAATTNTAWADHLHTDDEQCVHGVWVREKWTALVPDV